MNLRRVRSWKTRSLRLRKRDKMRRFLTRRDLKSSNSFSKRKLHRNSKQNRKSRSSLPPKQSKRPNKLLPRKLLLRLSLLNSRESTSSKEERLRHNFKCSKLNSNKRLKKLQNCLRANQLFNKKHHQPSQLLFKKLSPLSK
jgi:hypothetical protein